jgi:DNA-binding transcriptional regulator LsrR (DeoR family)
MEDLLPLHLRLKQAIEWLKANKQMKQMDIAQRMGMAEASFSRGLKRCVERVDENFIIKFHQATDEVFSLDWLLNGTGEKFTEKSKPQEQHPVIDHSSMVNASISAYIQLTNRLDEDLKKKEIEMQERLAEKDATIESQKAQITRLELTIADKDTIIKEKEARIVALERQLAEVSTPDIKHWPFSVGVADEGDRPRSNV